MILEMLVAMVSVQLYYVYLVVRQESGITQQLVRAKSRLANQGLTIPWLELISAHMVANLLVNVKDALQGLSVTELNGWLDSCGQYTM